MTTVIGCWHPGRDARAAMRRAIPRRNAPKLTICRSPRTLVQLLHGRLIDAVVIGVDTAPETLFELPAQYASIPVFGYGAFRSNSGRLLERCRQAGLAGVLVEGVDDPVLWQLLAPRTASARRHRALDDAPRLLRLTEAVQLDAWNEVLKRVGEPVRTTDLARSLALTREHLSREFGAGGAPNLKRVIDLATAICAADLLQSEAYTVRTVASILGGISPAQLNGIVKRVAGVTAPQLRQLGVRGVLREFLAGRTRSRL